jgi:hypothetical protein
MIKQSLLKTTGTIFKEVLNYYCNIGIFYKKILMIAKLQNIGTVYLQTITSETCTYSNIKYQVRSTKLFNPICFKALPPPFYIFINKYHARAFTNYYGTIY